MGSSCVGDYTAEMAGWEDNLIDELQQRKAAAATMTSPALDPLQLAFVSLVGRTRASIQRIAEAVGAGVEDRGSEADGRVRWTYGQRTLAIRFDQAAAKVFVSSDLGHTLIQEELTTVRADLVDQRGRPANVEDVAARFVTVLFKGDDPV